MGRIEYLPPFEVVSVLLVFASLVVAAAAVPANTFQDIGDSLISEANAVKRPILEIVTGVTFSQCDNVKKLLGLDYSQLEKRDQEPDLSQLSLIYVTKDGNVTLDFDTALKLLPKSPDFKTKSLVIFVQGFIINPNNKNAIFTITQGFLSRGSYNILALDASSLLQFFYLRSTSNVPFIGAKLSSFLVDLVKEGLLPSSIHLVGHSLGAHISGFAAKQFLAATGQRVKRISGLDPAGPCFEQLEPEYKLGPGDADFVDVMHTNGGVLALKEPVGQVDYYPNEGEQQPGCLLDTCSHSRSYEMYSESLHNDYAFPAVKCDSWEQFKKGNCSGTSYMGIASEPGTTGKFYLQTGSTAPYSLGKNGTQYVNNEGLLKSLLVSVLLVFASLVVAAAAVPTNFFQGLGEGFTKEANAVKQPVLETVVDISSGQCDNVKKLFGVDYSQMGRKDLEPDLNQLSLIYVTKDRNLTLNINTVSKLLPKSPDFNREYFVIYVHGFTDNPTKKSFGAISNGFLSRGLYNILALDGSSLIRWFYLRSTTYVRFIGQKLGSILADLVKEGLPPSSIHLVGHSLGAQISGFTGKQFLAATGKRVGRISGLDPAGPCFSQLEPALKLGPGDADFVDVIHTNAGVAGLKEPVGQVDYYPNEGEQQPGCLLDSCSHSRSWEMYSESLHNDYAFPAVRCDSWDEFKKGNCSGTSYMGIASEPGTTGKFYLQTGSTAPYSLGKNGTQYVNNEGFIKNLLG